MHTPKTTLRRLAAALAFVLGLAFLAPASALAADTKEVDNVKLLLMAYDTFPTAEDFKKVTKDPRAVLLAIWTDKNVKEIVRLQALDALSHFPDPTVRALYKEIIAADWEGDAPNKVHRAINGLMFGFGESAVEDVAPLLSHPDMQVRMTVAHAVGTSGGASGRALLRDHLAKEPNKIVREQIDKLVLEIR